MVLALHFTPPCPSSFSSVEIKLFDGQGGSADDASTSSTIAANTSSFKKPARLACRKKNKRVHFDEGCLTQYHAAVSTDAHHHAAWYSTADYKQFRVAAVAAAQHVVATEKRNRAPFSYQRVMERAYEVCSSSTTEKCDAADCVHLQRWLSVASSRVGLEKWCVRKVAQQKSVRRKAMVQIVLNAETLGLDELQVRVQLERLSRPSRLFCQTLAKGIAIVVRRDEYISC